MKTWEKVAIGQTSVLDVRQAVVGLIYKIVLNYFCATWREN
jgi:hypothetical protein